MKLQDGSGSGFEAKVDKNKRLHVDSVGRDQDQQATLTGDNFNITTGPITLSSANESAVFYLDYEGDDPFVIKEIIVILGATTDGSGDGTVKIIRNPTTGTIVSGAVDVDINVNRDFGSVKSITGSVYKGAEGNTLTDGETFANTTRSSFGTVINFDASTILLRKGNSIGLTYQPPAGNTSQVCRVALVGFIESSDVSDNGQ